MYWCWQISQVGRLRHANTEPVLGSIPSEESKIFFIVLMKVKQMEWWRGAWIAEWYCTQLLTSESCTMGHKIECWVRWHFIRTQFSIIWLVWYYELQNKKWWQRSNETFNDLEVIVIGVDIGVSLELLDGFEEVFLQLLNNLFAFIVQTSLLETWLE